MRKHFGSSPPPVADAESNISLFMVTSNWVFNYPVPLMPSVVMTHSLHVKTTTDPLPNVTVILSLFFTKYICLHLSTEHVTDCDNSLEVNPYPANVDNMASSYQC